MIDLNNPNRYIDLAKWFEKQDSFMDFEGMADIEGIEEQAVKAVELITKKEENPELFQILKTMMFHYIFTCRDQVGEEGYPSDDDCAEVVCALEMFVNCRYIMKEDAK